MERYYFYDDKKLIVYHSEEFLTDSNLVYLGTSDNSNWAMAAAVFTSKMVIKSGYKLVRSD